MNKLIKKILIAAASVLLLFALFIVAWVFLIFPNFVEPDQSEVSEPKPGPVSIAEESEQVDFNEENGVLYVNNEVVVFIRTTAAQDRIDALFDSLDAEVDNTMADIGVYRLVFANAMSYDELESLINRIKSESIVENAYINTVTELESDAEETEEDDFDYKDPDYPDDPWDNDTWDVSVPRGNNWGVEAIDAPGAWGYLDSLGNVRVGLIDSMPNTSHEDLAFSNTSSLFIDENTGLTNVNKYSVSADDHGTHVSGTINARWDNSTGVSGVMGGKGELYYSAVYYETDSGVTSRYATAYTYLLALKTLIDQDVQGINISQNTSRLIGFAASHGNQNAVNYLSMQADLTEKGLSRIIEARESAGKSDFVICVAAGNSNSTYYYKDDDEPYGYREEMTDWEAVKYLFGWRGEIGGSLALYNNFLNLMDEEEVKNRVIVVGAVGIDPGSSTSSQTRYSYAYFSNVGSRVDIVAPGVDVYSCTANGYGLLSGTSMATPHVTGVAGLVFASNPSLTGPEVKHILTASATGRYYHGGSYSGLLNANTAVVNALKTVDTSVNKVLQTETDNGLDLCFVVDTTGSMGDDIESAKENMASILEHLAEKTENYRVALIDYRDYPSRTNDSDDYPYKVQLEFSSNNTDITAAIDALDLGNGGDNEETVYSALMAAVRLDWRTDAKKVIIILGDAAPLDPEPETEFTYDQVLLALFNADINIDLDDSDDRVTDHLDTALINVFSIGADASSDAEDFFESISESTGGSYASVDDASKVGDAIIDSIEQIEVIEKLDVTADFGDALANEPIELYSEDGYMFTIETDGSGQFVIEEIEAGTYTWTSDTLDRGGSIVIEQGSRNAAVRTTRTYWFAPFVRMWENHPIEICAVFALYTALCIALPILMGRISRNVRRRKAAKAAAASDKTGATEAASSAAVTDTDVPAVTETAASEKAAETGGIWPDGDEAKNAFADELINGGGPDTETDDGADASCTDDIAPAEDNFIPDTSGDDAIPDDTVSAEDMSAHGADEAGDAAISETPVETEAETVPACPRCGEPVRPGASFCTKCGNDLRVRDKRAERRCPVCGSVCSDSASFCTNCGTKL